MGSSAHCLAVVQSRAKAVTKPVQQSPSASNTNCRWKWFRPTAWTDDDNEVEASRVVEGCLHLT